MSSITGIAADAQRLRRHLGRQVPVAEMPGDAHEGERVGGADFGERLGRGQNLDEAAVLEPEAVAAAQHRRLRQVEQEGEPADAGHDEAAAVALVELEHHAVGRLARPRPRGKNLVRPQHRSGPPPCLVRPPSMDERQKERQPACKPGSVWPGLIAPT